MQEQEITLSEILIAREERVAIQNALLGKYKAPVISFTMNMAGPVKVTALSHRAFLWGCQQLRLGFLQNKIAVLAEKTRALPTGDEAYFAIDAPAGKVKALCVEIEEANRMGRLFDMDVIGLDGTKLERGVERPCIVCGKPGRDCASRRLHSVAALRETTEILLHDGLVVTDHNRVPRLATQALLDEVSVTPKPGLVDRANSGAHKDMDFSSFQASASALAPYWESCFREGMRPAYPPKAEAFHSCHSERVGDGSPVPDSAAPAITLEQGTDPSTPLRSAKDDRWETIPPIETFSALRPLGKSAERDMLAATGGVNTHKGAIFTLGVLCGAIGRLYEPEIGFPGTEAILNEAAAMTRETLEAELPAARWNTAGEALYKQYGTRGIRGEVADGLPAVWEISLPVFKKLLAEGLDRNHAAAVTLLHLIANVEDTNLLHRGGKEGAAWAKKAAAALIAPAGHSEGVGDGFPVPESAPPAANLVKGTDSSTPLRFAQNDRQETLMHHADGRVPSLQEIAELDRKFIERNLSPGGCADLLAVTLFLERLEQEASGL